MISLFGKKSLSQKNDPIFCFGKAAQIFCLRCVFVPLSGNFLFVPQIFFVPTEQKIFVQKEQR
jgi:hypothetical protein